MIKIIVSIAVVVLIILFITFNIDNTSDISFIFFTVENIPVYLTIFFSLLLGALAMIPFSLGYRKKKKKPSSIENLEQEINTSFEEKFSDSAKGKKKKRGKKGEKAASGLDIASPDKK